MSQVVLQPGQNVPAPGSSFRVSLSGSESGLEAFMMPVNAAGACVVSSACFSGARVAGGVSWLGGGSFDVSLGAVSEGLRLVFVLVPAGAGGGVVDAVFRVGDGLVGSFRGSSGGAVLLGGEVYFRNGGWRVRFLGGSVAGGFGGFVKHFGLSGADAGVLQGAFVPAPQARPPAPPAPPAPPTPAPATPPSPPKPPAPPAAAASPTAAKIVLTKGNANAAVRLDKAAGAVVRVNLNWNRSSGGLFKRRAVDLDLGAFVELRSGEKFVIQALGNAFGNLGAAPFVQLLGDDRTGESAGGEWLHVNAQRWGDIRRVLVYTFIYEGAPSWRATDAVTQVLIGGSPPVEVALSEYDGPLGSCAIATLWSEGGSVRVERHVSFHRDQSVLDQAYGWGFRWSSGRK